MLKYTLKPVLASLLAIMLVVSLFSIAYTQEESAEQTTTTTTTSSSSGSSDLFMRNPGLMIGGSLGAGVHASTSFAAVTDSGFLLSFLLDFGFQAGPGNVGGQFHFDYITPIGLYSFNTVSFGLLPRYMVDFAINKGIVSVAPFAGWNFQFNILVNGDAQFRFTSGLAFGVFVQVIEHLHVFNEFDLNFIGVQENGWTYTNYLIKFGVSYKVVVF